MTEELQRLRRDQSLEATLNITSLNETFDTPALTNDSHIANATTSPNDAVLASAIAPASLGSHVFSEEDISNRARIYTEQLIARKQVQRDQSAQDFLDLFNHRLVSLFWLAWAKHRPEIGRQFGFHNSVYRYLEHIVGLGTPALQAKLYPKQRGTAR